MSIKDQNFPLAGKMILLYGQPGMGKTTMACSFPNPKFLATEYCHHYVPEEIEVTHFSPDASGWDEFRKVVSSVRSITNTTTFVIDTISNLYDSCLQWVCKKMGIDHPSDSPYKAYDKIKAEFSRTIRKLSHYANMNGHCVLTICHSKERETAVKSGGVVVDVQVNLPGTAKDILLPMCQYVWYMKPGGKDRREIITKMDTGSIFAKCADTAVKVSKIVNVPPTGQYDYILEKMHG